MAIGTTKEILQDKRKIRKMTGGRPKVNRELAMELINSGYSTQYIRRILKCSSRTIRMIKEEMKKQNLLKATEPTEELERLSLEFDEEMERARGTSFYSWLKGSIKAYRRMFNFNKQVWETVFERASLIMVADQSNPLGSQLCQKFMDVFGEDKKRIRSRKHQLRYMFRFLGRMDLCDTYLRTPESQNPRAIREIPEISLPDFPKKLNQVFADLEKVNWEIAVAAYFKLATQMRTGKNEKELMGLTVGKAEGSYILMPDLNTVRSQIIGKQNEKWVLNWIPKAVRINVFNLYKTRQYGEKLFQFDIQEFRELFKEICQKRGLPPLRLHDLRKASITFLWVMGIPMEIATEINVGWKDLNTVKRHYLKLRKLINKDQRQQYKDNIPDWFKEGLDQFADF